MPNWKDSKTNRRYETESPSFEKYSPNRDHNFKKTELYAFKSTEETKEKVRAMNQFRLFRPQQRIVFN